MGYFGLKKDFVIKSGFFFPLGNGRWGEREGGREKFYSSFKVIEQNEALPNLKYVKSKYEKCFKKTKY